MWLPQRFQCPICFSFYVGKWRISLDKGGYSRDILLDLFKAFDTINHDLLVAKLYAYGFDKNAWSLVKSYLSDRWQRIKMNSSFSTWSGLLLRIPQGSILGPILFNLFLNDLFFVIKETDLFNYADDNTPYTSDISLSSLMNRLESTTGTAMEWFRNNRMQPNFK